MNKILKLLPIFFILVTLFVSCSKKPLTLDNETSMKTLLKASDAEITELIKKEANERVVEIMSVNKIITDAFTVITIQFLLNCYFIFISH